MTTQITDHETQALARLKEQFQSSDNVRSLVSAFAAPSQDVEDALWQLLVERSVDEAVGAQLDAIGSLVGQARNGLDDDDYRRYVRARISANRSNGTVEDILKVARLIVDDEDASLTWDPQPTAAGVLRVHQILFPDATAEILIAFLRDTISAGVRVLLEWTPIADSALLYLDIDNLDQEQFIAAIE